MAVGNNYTTFDASGAGGIGLGLRESLADKIYQISPTETPALTMSRKEKAEAVYEEWLIDTLAAAVSTNAAIEGDDATVAAVTPQTRVGNRCQIAQKAFGITGTLEAVKKAGRAKEMGYQLSKKSAEIKRDIESSLLANLASVTGNETTARVLGGLPTWLTTNLGSAGSNFGFGTGGSGGGFSAGNTVVRVNGTPRPFIQLQVDNAMQSAWQQGGKPSMLLLGAKQRGVFSGFDGISSQQQVDVKDRMIYGAADVYVSNWGNLRVAPDRFIRQVSSIDYDVFGLEPEYLAIGELRPFFVRELAVTGDREQRQLIWEGTLKVLNEAAHFLITDLN